jgi:uncharacterized membrane protein
MKKLIIIWSVSVLVFTLCMAKPLSSQTSQKPAVVTNSIPADVMKVIKKTCVTCHMEPGNKMALSHFNVAKWGEYSPEKQATKANEICKQVSKENMHPKKFLKEHPEAVPTKDEIKTICDWASKMQQK